MEILINTFWSLWMTWSIPNSYSIDWKEFSIDQKIEEIHHEVSGWLDRFTILVQLIECSSIDSRFLFNWSNGTFDQSQGILDRPNVTSREFKKKKKCKSEFCGPHVPPPNPTTHHSHPLNFTHISSLFWPALSFLSFIFFLFILLKHTHTHPPASTPKHTISPSFFRQDHRKNT